VTSKYQFHPNSVHSTIRDRRSSFASGRRVRARAGAWSEEDLVDFGGAKLGKNFGERVWLDLHNAGKWLIDDDNNKQS
jgi:hypothetical protein